MYRLRLLVIIYGGGDGYGKELLKLGGREAFIGVGNRRKDICISKSAVVGREDQWQ